MENLICDKFKDEIEKFEEWIRGQPKLPKNMSNHITTKKNLNTGKFNYWLNLTCLNLEKILFLKYLKVSDFEHENARKLLLLNLELREKNPQLFTNRDVRGERFQKAIQTMWVLNSSAGSKSLYLKPDLFSFCNV